MPSTCTVRLVRIALSSGTSLIALLAMPAQAQTVCLTSPLGILECAPTTPVDAVVLPGQTVPVTITLPDGYAGTTSIVADSTDSLSLVGNGNAIVSATTGPALDLASDADITAQITALSTAGDGAAGALLAATDDAVLIVDDSVTTLGDFADGINVTAGSADVAVGEVRTVGIESDGVEIVTATGPATLNADLIETLGSGSTDAIIRSAGDIGVNVGVLRSGGDQALGLDLQSDAGACAVLGAGSCNIDAVAGNITTGGFGSIGALVVAAGDTNVDVGALQTGGDEAAGLNLSADPTTCIAFGVGGCDTAFTVQNLATNGARSPGAVVRAVGNIDGNVGVLSTQGEDAIGLDLASDPTVCAVLGAGGCETSFSVGQLTTNGAGATGALVRAAGPTTANFGTVDTFGEGANGVDISGDPAACAVLGVGACDTSLTAERISTAGDFAGGVLVNAPGRIATQIGLISTDGDGSTALALINDAGLCATLGTGACGVTVGQAPNGGAPGGPTGGTPGTPGGTNIDTDGNDAPGAVIVTPGPVDADFGTVDTDGDDSPGVVVDGGEGPIDVDFDAIDTDGAASPGVDIAGTGSINVGGGTVDTSGAASPGVLVVGDDGLVTIDVAAIVTRGPGSNGVDVTTTTGTQAIAAGPVTVTGLGSNGIDATATGCGAVNVTARAPVTSSAGAGINAASACTVTVRTLRTAAVSGAAAGINVVSGTGATVTIGDALSSSAGPALNIDGGPAAVVIEPTGTLTGRFDLTDAADTLSNAGLIDATADSSFGAGTDVLVNTGTVRVRGVRLFAGLETTANSGLIDLRDGATDDTLTLPGSYTGSGAAALGVDAAAGTASDRLIVAGAATGSTAVLVAGGLFTAGAVVVDAGAGTSPTAFTLSVSSDGLVDYALVYNAAANDFALYGTPSIGAVGAALLASAAREGFYFTNDAIGAHMEAAAEWSGEQPPFARALWLQAYHMEQDRERTLDATPLGQPRSYNLGTSQQWQGVQGGLDLFGGPGSVVGVTGGYSNSELRLDGASLRADYEAANVGAYSRIGAGPLTIRGMVKYEWYWADLRDLAVAFAASPKGSGWGGLIEASLRLGSPALFVEPLVSIEYSSLSIDDFSGLGTAFVIDEAEGLRGKAGARFGALLTSGPSPLEAYGKVQAIHEWRGEDRLTVTNNGITVPFDLPRPETYGRATLGLSSTLTASLRGFFEGSADFAGGVSGYGARLGFSAKF